MAPVTLNWEGTFDSSVVVEAHIDDGVLHHQSGPMGPKQLTEDWLMFEASDIPDVFVFLLASVESEEVVQYPDGSMRRRLTQWMEACKTHADKFGQMWENIV